MRTSRPAAWSTLSVLEIFLEPGQSALPRFGFYRIFNPANPLVARERGNVFPALQRRAVFNKDAPQIFRDGVNNTAGNFFSWHDQYQRIGTDIASGTTAINE
ncbi:MAG TPA: hypothetical protein VFN25_13810 [Dokdonella sp.]|nr:hypothetical protein [Dokdonella sp.]HET9033966.1 hypothetical protein [Dokdonella sp.]